jgi:hypothetical protein
MSLLAIIHHASYPIFVHRLTVSFHASFPRSVTLTQLHFISLAVVSSREDFHLQDRAHAGRTHPGQTPLQLQGIRCAPTDARELSHRTVWKTLRDLKRLLGSETQTLLPCPRQNPAHAISPSSPARLGLQPIPPLAACSPTSGREDVNRTSHSQFITQVEPIPETVENHLQDSLE